MQRPWGRGVQQSAPWFLMRGDPYIVVCYQASLLTFASHDVSLALEICHSRCIYTIGIDRTPTLPLSLGHHISLGSKLLHSCLSVPPLPQWMAASSLFPRCSSGASLSSFLCPDLNRSFRRQNNNSEQSLPSHFPHCPIRWTVVLCHLRGPKAQRDLVTSETTQLVSDRLKWSPGHWVRSHRANL